MDVRFVFAFTKKLLPDSKSIANQGDPIYIALGSIDRSPDMIHQFWKCWINHHPYLVDEKEQVCESRRAFWLRDSIISSQLRDSAGFTPDFPRFFQRLFFVGTDFCTSLRLSQLSFICIKDCEASSACYRSTGQNFQISVHRRFVAVRFLMLKESAFFLQHLLMGYLSTI